MTEPDGASSTGIGRATAPALAYSSSTSCGVSRLRGHSGSASRNVRPQDSVRCGTDGLPDILGEPQDLLEEELPLGQRRELRPLRVSAANGGPALAARPMDRHTHNC